MTGRTPTWAAERARAVLDELQLAVDELAERLQRSVAVDDPAIALIASSRHFGDEDPLRVSALVGRRPSPEATRAILGLGISSLQVPTRLPAVPAIDFTERVCLPLREGAALVGYLWLIDDGCVSDAEIGQAWEVAAIIAPLISLRGRAQEEALDERDRLVADLLGGGEPARQAAIDTMLGLGLGGLAGAGPEQRHCTVLVTMPVLTAHGEDTGALRRARLRMRSVGGGELGGARLPAVVGDAVVTLWMTRTPPDPRGADRLARQLQAVASHAGADGQEGGRDGSQPAWVTGCGGSVDDLARAWESCEQARAAVMAARRRAAPVALWTALAPLDLVAVLTSPPPSPHLSPPLLAGLREKIPADMLTTLRCYLDAAGDVSRVAQRLHLHRSTVYHRLSRVEQLLGLNLSDGRNRLALHLALFVTGELSPDDDASGPGGPDPAM